MLREASRQSCRSKGARALSRILVTDAEQRASLAVVRSLGRAGHHVEVCSAHARPLAGASKYARRSSRTPDPGQYPDGYREAVMATITRGSIDVLLPTTDVSIAALSDIQDRLPDLTVACSGREAYERLSDKLLLTEVAPTLGIAVPEQIVLRGPDEVDLDSLSNLGLPLVLKPAKSEVETAEGTERQVVRMVSSEAELAEALESLAPEAYPILAQQRIVGPGRGVFVLVWEGRIYAASGHRRIREKPLTGGVSVYRESVAVPDDLLEKSRRLLERFAWNGVAMVEFKEDEVTGTPYLMEVNARFWGSLQLAIDSGVDFPTILVDLATGGQQTPSPPAKVGVRSRWLWGEVDHLIAALRTPSSTRQSYADLPTPWGALGNFLIPWRPGDRLEVLRLGDPGPFLRESVGWLRSLRR